MSMQSGMQEAASGQVKLHCQRSTCNEGSVVLHVWEAASTLKRAVAAFIQDG